MAGFSEPRPRGILAPVEKLFARSSWCSYFHFLTLLAVEIRRVIRISAALILRRLRVHA